jgi:hypothetical protein
MYYMIGSTKTLSAQYQNCTAVIISQSNPQAIVSCIMDMMAFKAARLEEIKQLFYKGSSTKMFGRFLDK